MGKIVCPPCGWEWEKENDDDRPYLCHKCGYDMEIEEYDMEALKKWEEENDHPFEEEKKGDYVLRTFSEGVDDKELVWHRDRETRVVKSIKETDWMIQIDNELPKTLNETVYIPKGVYHRVIKGKGDLNVKILKIK